MFKLRGLIPRCRASDAFQLGMHHNCRRRDDHLRPLRRGFYPETSRCWRVLNAAAEVLLWIGQGRIRYLKMDPKAGQEGHLCGLYLYHGLGCRIGPHGPVSCTSISTRLGCRSCNPATSYILSDRPPGDMQGVRASFLLAD